VFRCVILFDLSLLSDDDEGRFFSVLFLQSHFVRVGWAGVSYYGDVVALY